MSEVRGQGREEAEVRSRRSEDRGQRRGLAPQYDLPDLPRLNKCKNGFNWAGGVNKDAKAQRMLRKQ